MLSEIQKVAESAGREQFATRVKPILEGDWAAQLGGKRIVIVDSFSTDEWTPLLDIVDVRDYDAKEPFPIDSFVIEVLANADGHFYRSRAELGGKIGGVTAAWLSENDVNGYYYNFNGERIHQHTISHEFGHLIGLRHPGAEGATDEYTKDPHALMGMGSELRAAYFQAWADALHKYREVRDPE